MRIYEVTDPFCGDKLRFTEDERPGLLDEFAVKSQNEPTEELRAVANKWFWAYWNAPVVDEWEDVSDGREN